MVSPHPIDIPCRSLKAAIDFFAFQMEAVLVLLVARHREEVSRNSVARSLVSGEFFHKGIDEFSIQIEGTEGIQNYQEIVKVEGIGCIQTGRNDISLALGVPGEQFHPKVLEMEKRIVGAALDAGKQVSLVHPANDDGIERISRWIEQGVNIHTVETDLTALSSFYSRALGRLKG